MHWIINTLEKVENTLMVTAFVGAFVLGVAQVFMRYVLKTGIAWTEQFVITLVILAAMMGGSRAVATGVHVRISLLVDRYQPEIRRYFDVFGNFVSIAYCLVMAYGGFVYARFLQQMGTTSSESDFPLWIVFMIVPVSMVFFSVRYVLDLPAAWSGERKDALDLVD